MFIRRTRLRVPGLVGAFLLLLAGGLDAVGGKTCLHHRHAGGPHSALGHGHAQGTVHDSAEAARPDHHDHAAHGHQHPGHAAAEASPASAGDEPAEPECDCGFICLGVAGPSSVQSPPTVDDRDLLPSETRLQAFRVYDGNLRATWVPFLLPYSNGPPTHA
jgi:hypothetical protein